MSKNDPVGVDVHRYPITFGGKKSTSVHGLDASRMVVVLGASVHASLYHEDRPEEADVIANAHKITVLVDDVPVLHEVPLARVFGVTGERLMWRDRAVDEPIIITKRSEIVRVEIVVTRIRKGGNASRGGPWEVHVHVAR
jgi:hypothetical protein